MGADVYAYGVLLWEILTRRRPWADKARFSHNIIPLVLEGERPDYMREQQKYSDMHAQAEFIELMEACWAQETAERPASHDVVVRASHIVRLLGGTHTNAGKECERESMIGPLV